MSKNKSKPKNDRSKLPAGNPIPDWRVVEGLMAKELAPRGDCNFDDAAARAQELIYQAFDAPPDQQVTLARQALRIWHDCADAYVLLAELSDDLEMAQGFYERGVAAGRRALGPDFEALAGQFWGFVETRPYMRARLGLAQCLYQAGQRDAAAGHYREMLQLNPNDNQGVREILASLLLELNCDEELDQLLERYQDDASAAWVYTRALLAFRQMGDCAESRKLLAAARKQNKHVPAFLLGDKPLPRSLPNYVGFGDRNEAVAYAANFLSGWKATPGAISWLREAAATKARKNAAPRRAEHIAPILPEEDLRAIPQVRDEIWQADVRRMPAWVKEHGRLVRPWMILVTDATNDAILAFQMTIDKPTSQQLWAQVAAAISKPAVGKPRRPGIVEVCAADDLRFVQPRLDAIEIRCEVRDDLNHMDYVMKQFSEQQQNNNTLPALVDAPGIDATLLSEFFDAASAFYRLAPWRLVAGDTPIELACPELSAQPWYAVVMGQCGVELGMALYDDLAALRSIFAQDLSDAEIASRTSAISVTFGEPFEMPIRDLDAIDRYGWSVAAPEAYPCVLRIRPNQQLDLPQVHELKLLETGLRTVPGFLAQKEQSSKTTTADGYSVLLRRVEC